MDERQAVTRKHSAEENYHRTTHLLEEEQAENYQPMSQNKYINKEKKERRGERDHIKKLPQGAGN